jgi:hypothetical protein
LDGDRAVLPFLRREVVKRIGVVRIRLKVAFGVVDGNRPKAVDRYVFDVELVFSLAVILDGRVRTLHGGAVHVPCGSMLSIKSARSSARATIESRCRVL